MKEYHKIQTVFKRNPETKFKTLLEGEYSLPEFKYLVNNEWIFTEKVDGTNIRVMFKTDNAQIPPFLLERLNKIFLPQLESFEFPDGVCLYGEGYGAKIQKGGGNYRQDQNFVLFDVKIGDWWLQRKDVEDIATKLNLDVVPIIGVGTLELMVEKVRNGFHSYWGDFQAEGIVARPTTELKTRAGYRIITKIKYKDFNRN
jgi:ATP-dependent RNA circularization protein (DNA/RNA ligase family)